MAVYGGAMSSLMRPVGPEDPQVYWKRRAILVMVALIALIVLFCVFAWIWPDGTPSASGPASPTPTVTPQPTATPTTTPTASPTAGGLCPDAGIDVVVTTNESTYQPGVNPQVTMAITNGGTVACQRDLGSGANEITVVSQGTRIWSSDDCSTSSEADVQTLQPGESATVELTWDRVKSEPGCAGDATDVPAGEYTIVGRNGQVHSEPAAITLQ